ncbi:MAG: hypothetical protein FD143_183 [Ignavibacteria bacterium]|nr:MAG: hypothetical protein FD143_183 [Ignavibacteria bacterium]
MIEKSNKIKERSFDFALSIIKLYSELKKYSEIVLLKQLLRSGTSIGANVHEASAASSKRDFLNKMAIASKEARETEYWLKLISESNLISFDFKPFLLEINELRASLKIVILNDQPRRLGGSEESQLCLFERKRRFP